MKVKTPEQLEMVALYEHMLARLEQVLAFLEGGNPYMAKAKILADISLIKGILARDE